MLRTGEHQNVCKGYKCKDMICSEKVEEKPPESAEEDSAVEDRKKKKKKSSENEETDKEDGMDGM